MWYARAAFSLLTVAVIHGASSPAGVGHEFPANLTDAAAGELARQAREALLIFEENPHDHEALETGLQAFNRLHESAGWERFSPETTTTAGSATLLLLRLAEEGDKKCIEAFMLASMGPYGRTTAEGGEWLNEILWTLLSRQAQLVLDLLAELDPEERLWLVDHVYTRPVHDNMDFVGIEERLSTTTTPVGIDQEVGRIRDAVEAHAQQVAPPDARDRARMAEEAANRGGEGYVDALHEYEAAIELAPYWADLHYRLGLLHMKHGHTREAIESFNAYLEMNPPAHPRILNQIRLVVETLKESMAAEAPAAP